MLSTVDGMKLPAGCPSAARRKTAMIASLAICWIVSQSATGLSATTPRLVTADWSTVNASPMSTNPPSVQDVTDLISYLQTPVIAGVPTDTVCSFRFANLRNTGTLSLVATVNEGAGFCNSIFIVDKTAGGFSINQVTGAKGCGQDLSTVVQDLSANGTYELVVDTNFTFDQGLDHCAASWPVIYGWTGSQYADVSSQYMSYYTQQIASLQQQTPPAEVAPCVSAEIAKLERFTGQDKTAGLGDAIKWAESDNPHVRGFAAPILADIGTSEALSDLQTLSHDTHRGVATDANSSLRWRSGSGPRYVVYPVAVSTPQPASVGTSSGGSSSGQSAGKH